MERRSIIHSRDRRVQRKAKSSMLRWEGTFNIMADDTIRVLTGRDGRVVFDALESWCKAYQNKTGIYDNEILMNKLKQVKQHVAAMDRAELAFRSPENMEILGWVVSATLLVQDALRDKYNVALELASRWIGKEDKRLQQQLSTRSWKELAALDRAIVFGHPILSSSRL